MNIKYKIILRIIFITTVPVILNYLAKSDNCLDYFQRQGFIGANINLSFWKDFFLLAGIIFSAVFLSIRLACVEIDQKTIANQRKSLIKYNKEIFLSALQSKMLISNMNMNIRIYVPKRGILLAIKKLLEKLSCGYIKVKREFAIRNIDGLADTGITNNLSYDVYPRPQGLIGSCYKTRTIVYDENYKKNSVYYNLTEYQISKTHDIEFCLCAPVFNTKGDIISIVSFDSVQKVNISKANKAIWIDMIANYCQYLNDYLPELFR